MLFRFFYVSFPLQTFKIFLNNIVRNQNISNFDLTLQNHIYEWVRDHRVHHKFTDTDADPHNAQRGFFFSHMGWLLVRKHPDVFKKGATVDLSDLEKDPIVVWQRR